MMDTTSKWKISKDTEDLNSVGLTLLRTHLYDTAPNGGRTRDLLNVFWMSTRNNSPRKLNTSPDIVKRFGSFKIGLLAIMELN